tara:strand:+ start:29062 stop:29226 length:165 start_codon:yes stop_codon:yes gene_type:complete
MERKYTWYSHSMLFLNEIKSLKIIKELKMKYITTSNNDNAFQKLISNEIRDLNI